MGHIIQVLWILEALLSTQLQNSFSVTLNNKCLIKDRSFSDDVIALKECPLMVNRVLNCIKGGSQGVIDKLASTSASCKAP